jgi:4-hydroxy-tetrahydrodipicolinate reductase
LERNVLKIAVLGGSGRMGRAVIASLAESAEFALAGAVTVPGDPVLGRDAGEVAGVGALNVLLTDDRMHALQGAQVAIDFTLPTATQANLQVCIETGTPLVIGTTGLLAKHEKLLQAAAQHIPLVFGRNMSVGANVFMAVVQDVAKALGPEYDAEIIEAHHRHKVDAPSGTALALGERIAGARGRRLEELAVYARHGHTGPRVPGTIGFAVVRGGGIVGDHSVVFVGPEERVELIHRADDRRTFARGAIRAAQWVAGRAPGLYSMNDVLGLSAP